MPRKGENIHKRPDGRWEGRYPLFYKEDKTIHYGSVYARTYKEAKRKLEAARQSHPFLYQREAARCETFHALILLYLEDARQNLKESSYVLYRRRCEQYILPALGDIKCTSLTSDRIARFLEEKKRTDGLSDSTTAGLRATLGAILRYGFSHRHIAYIEIPRLKKPEKRADPAVISEEDCVRVNRYLEAHTGLRSLGIRLCFATGMRLGEICALKRSDIRLEQGILQVSATMGRIQDMDPASDRKTKVVVTSPKTVHSCREIPLPTSLLEELAQLKMAPDAYLLTGESGRFCEPRRMTAYFSRVLAASGASHYRFHSIRHTFATRSVAMGFDTKILSEILGHANVAFTMSHYVHPSMTEKRKMLDKLAAACLQMNGQENGQTSRRS
jgi:integrase